MLAAFAAFLFYKAGVKYADIRPLFLWKRTEAIVSSAKIAHQHDGQGVLYFRVNPTLSYTVDGQQRTASPTSYYGSSNYGWITRKMTR